MHKRIRKSKIALDKLHVMTIDVLTVKFTVDYPTLSWGASR